MDGVGTGLGRTRHGNDATTAGALSQVALVWSWEHDEPYVAYERAYAGWASEEQRGAKTGRHVSTTVLVDLPVEL